MSESEEPNWPAELAQSGEAMRRQVEPILEAVQQFVRDAQLAKVMRGPALPFVQRMALAFDAGIRELLPPPEPVGRHVTPPGAIFSAASLSGVGTLTGMAFPGAASLSGEGTLTFTGSIALPPARVSGQMTVEARPTGFAAFSDGEKVAFVLVWLYAIWLPWFASRLPPELHGMLTDAVTNFAVALAISWRMFDKHK